MSTVSKARNIKDCHVCQSYNFTLFFTILFALIIIFGVLGNTFVVGVIVSDRKLLNSSVNRFLLNLALADLGNLVFCTPDAALVLLDKGWLLPETACHLVRFLQEYFLYASVLLQMSIGIERFLAICSPLRMQRFSSKTTMIVIVFVWGGAAAVATPYFIYQGVTTFDKFNFCFWKGITKKTKVLFKYAEFLMLYAVPIVILTVLYTVMGRVLWGKSSSIANESQQASILKLRRSVVKMLIISMLLYYLCYTPIQGVFVLETVIQQSVSLDPWLRLLFNALSVMSSSLNPIVYIICCRHFHSRFLSLSHSALNFFLFPCRPRPVKYCSDGEASLATKLSRSPYVSFRKSQRRRDNNQQSITLL